MKQLLTLVFVAWPTLGLVIVDSQNSDIRIIASSVSIEHPVLIQHMYTTSNSYFWEVKPDTKNGAIDWRLVIARDGDKWSIQEDISDLPKRVPDALSAKRFELSMLELRRHGLLKAPMLVVESRRVLRFSYLPLSPGRFIETTVDEDGKVVIFRGE